MPALAVLGKQLNGGCVLLALLTACGADTPRRFPLTIHATDDTGRPLRGVDVWARGASLGESDARGAIRTRTTGHAGDVVRIRARCPAGYRLQEGERRWVLADAASPTSPEPDLRIRCHATEHQAALVVRASTEHGDPLMAVEVHVDGEQVGQTDADGTEHILLKRAAGSRVTVALDASGHPQILAPQHVQSTLVGDADAVVLVDRAFAVAGPVRKPKRRRPPRPIHGANPARPKPFRIR